jgi:hypothetical protein
MGKDRRTLRKTKYELKYINGRGYVVTGPDGFETSSYEALVNELNRLLESNRRYR